LLNALGKVNPIPKERENVLHLAKGQPDHRIVAPVRAPQSHVGQTNIAEETPRPNPQSQFFSRSYESILPTSLIYIVLSTRGFSPWRPDAVMSTTKCVNKISPPNFQGSSRTHRTLQKLKCFTSHGTLSPSKSIPG
jgi:hypothetical protein